MHSIAWQMRYGLPNSRYMGVVSSLRRHGAGAAGNQRDDPLPAQISPHMQNRSNVISRIVQAELSRPGYTIIHSAGTARRRHV
jgi:hypothetical protein